VATALEGIGTYIDNNNATLTLGTNLFLAKMPETPDLCVAVYETQGFAPTMTFGSTPIEIDRPNIQVAVRAGRDDYPAARDLAQTLRTLVAGIINQTVGGVTIIRAEPTGSLYTLSSDNLERPRVVFNVDCLVDV